MKIKIIALISIILGIANMMSVMFDNAWYHVLCFILLGAGPVIFSLFVIAKDRPESIRTIAWTDVIFGFSILSLATSEFYGNTSVPFIQYGVGILLLIVGGIGLFQIIKDKEIEIIP